MPDGNDTQAALFQEIIADLTQKCLENGLSAPFSINLTDQNDVTISVAFIPDKERGGVKIHGIKGPDQDKAPEFVFPLKVHADDYEGKIYETEIHSKH